MRDVLIIGAGPAGIAAAIQLKRYNIDASVFEKNEPGGLLVEANLVENYPGFPGGIKGRDLVTLLKRQIKDYKIDLYKETVNRLSYENEEFIAETSGDKYKSRITVIASGTVPLKLEDISDDVGKKVFYDIKNISTLSGHKIAIIGAGDIAFDYALNLSERNEVIVLNRSNRIKCLPLLFKRAISNEAISYRENVGVKSINMFKAGLRVFCNKNVNFDVDYVLAAIGKRPNLDFVSDHLRENASRLRGERKLFIIGDVANGKYRQAGISIGEGIKAAMEIAGSIRDKELCGY